MSFKCFAPTSWPAWHCGGVAQICQLASSIQRHTEGQKGVQSRQPALAPHSRNVFLALILLTACINQAACQAWPAAQDPTAVRLAWISPLNFASTAGGTRYVRPGSKGHKQV
jgi:hypothetical protein